MAQQQYWNTPTGYMQPTSFSYPPQNTAGNWPQYQQTMSPVSIVPINGGRAAAEDYPVAPGAKVFLVDLNELVTYVKERDPRGQSTSFAIYDWALREDPKPETQAAIDYDKIRAMISEEVSAAMSNRQKNYKKEAK